VDGKRRLPLLPAQQPSGGLGAGEGGDDPKRPPWQWVGFGAVIVFTAWLPLTGVAGALAARIAASDPGDHLSRTGAEIVGLHACAIALGSFAGGFVVGRWGGDGVGVREAAFAGLVAAVVAFVAVWATSGFSAGALAVVVVAVSSAAGGGARGLRARTRLP
jgi:hypothetical protein